MDITRTNAKDFGRYPELLGPHIQRIMRAREAAENYMVNPRALLTEGLARFEDFTYQHIGLAARIAAEIQAIAPGDSKRADSLVSATSPASASRMCAEVIRAAVCEMFGNRRAEAERKFGASTYLQHLVNSPDDNDKQKVFHSDTFFPALKFWYFPQAVDVDDGPLWYVPNSPVLTPQLLAWHQRQVDDIAAGKVEPWRGHGHTEGSLRINLEEIAALGLKPEPVTVEADTLVVVNVWGFHARGNTKTTTHRLSIHGSIRLDHPL